MKIAKYLNQFKFPSDGENINKPKTTSEMYVAPLTFRLFADFADSADSAPILKSIFAANKCPYMDDKDRIKNQ